MSGPKVVRVVTREELEATCNRLLAVARAAAAELITLLKRNGMSTSQIEADVETRLGLLSDHIAKGRFSQVQKQAPAQAEFFRQETDRCRQAAIAKAEKLSLERKRLADAARSVGEAIARTGQAVPGELAGIVERAGRASEAQLHAMRSIVDGAFQLLLKAEAPGGPVASSQLASKLSRGLSQQSLAEWLASRPKPAVIPDRLSKLLAELEVYGNEELLSSFSARAAAIDAVASERRALLVDSLVLDAAAALRAAKVDAEKHARLAELLAELDTLGGEAAPIRSEVASMISMADYELADALLERGRSHIESRAREHGADSRRRAVLEGLASLGYEVREGMVTAWATDNRLVVARAGSTDYGVELASPADASRLSMRVVGAEHPRTPRSKERDVDQETIWCGEVGELIATLELNGTDLVIERSQEVGAQPLKTTNLLGASSPDAEVASTSKPRARTID